MIPTSSLILTEEQCRECVGYYIDLLRLSDWDIDIGCVRVSSVDETPGMAACSPSEKRKRATIWIYMPDDAEAMVESGDIDPIDTEHCIVHELPHIHHSAVDDICRGAGRVNLRRRGARAIDTAIEQHIEGLSWVITRLRREGDHLFSWER